MLAKHMRCDTFAGGPWDDWAFAFKRGVRSQNPEVFKGMQQAEVAQDEVNEDTDIPSEMEVRSAELYDLLCQFCVGEALGIVKATTDMHGFEAWQKLHRKYNPRTMARGVRLLGEVVSPPAIKELTEIETQVNRWEDRVKMLHSQFNEELSNNMRIAVFTNMMPGPVQDYIYSHVEKDVRYDELRDKIQAMVSNKIAVSGGPTPMDVGEIAGKGGEGDRWQTGDDWEVDAVWPTSQCHRCGGYGHFARDCATEKGFEKGKGKGGDKGKGKGLQNTPKGVGKGASKGKGGSQKGGSGKGYQGACWNCGKVGHKAAECRAAGAGAVEFEEGIEENVDCGNVEMGGVWVIGNVEAKENDVNSASAGNTLNRMKGHMRTFNKFEALQEDVAEEDDGEDPVVEEPPNEAQTPRTQPRRLPQRGGERSVSSELFGLPVNSQGGCPSAGGSEVLAEEMRRWTLWTMG